MSLRLLLFVTLSACIPTSAQVTRLTDNSFSDSSPKLVKDNLGRVWCFWLSNQDTTSYISSIFYRRLENGIWLPSQRVSGTGNLYYFEYDVDIDTAGHMWLARPLDTTVTIFKILPNDRFEPIVALGDRSIKGFSYQYVTLAAVDSNKIWIDYSRQKFVGDFRWLYEFNGKAFVSRGFLTSFDADIQTNPAVSLKTAGGKVHFLRDGTYDGHGNPPFPYLELLSSTPNDSMRLGTSTTYSDQGMAGSAQDSLLYFFSYAPLGNRLVPSLRVINASTNTVLTRLNNLRYMPAVASKGGSFLATASIQSNRIVVQGIKSLQLLLPGILPEDQLAGDTARSSLSILADDYPRIWIAWNGKLHGQDEIFVARTQVPIVPDTALILGVSIPRSHNNDHISGFSLEQCFPNPFNPRASINYTISEDALVILQIYDVLGRLVGTLVDEVQSRGPHTVQIDAHNMASGIYFYKLSSGVNHQTRAMVVSK